MSRVIVLQQYEFQELWDTHRHYFIEESEKEIRPWEVIVFQEVSNALPRKKLTPTGRELYTNATHVSIRPGSADTRKTCVFEFRIWKRIDPETLPHKRKPSI